MAEFEAKITGIADLSKAKQDFDSFKKSMEQPIKLTIDANGFNAVWGNIQKQAQQSGIQIGNSLVQGVQKTIRSGSNKVSNDVAKAMFDGILPDKKILFSGGALDAIGTYSDAVKAIKKEFQDIEKSGGFLKNFKFGEDFKSFTAEITNGANATIKVLGELGDIFNDKGEVVGHRWVTTNQSYIVDLSSSMKQAQTEAQKLSQELANVSNAFSSGAFDANISKMEQGLMGISNNVSSDLVKKASDAAAEYYRITQEISNSLANPNQQGVLQGQQLADAYKQAEVSLKTYNNAMTEVRANTQKMLAEGVGARNANQVETWARNNSKALKQYGDQLTDLANKMRNAQTQGELNGYVNQFKNLKAEITAAGLGGKSFGDQLKNAFVHIGEFTGIYAITSQIRQLPQEMVQEVIKIDTAMTELRKVSTASASEISDYFDSATESARKYGQTVDEIIDSTASWTRLGYNLEDATELSRVSALLGQVGSGLDVESASNGLQAVIKGFNGAAQEAEHYGDIINYIADTQPLNAQDIIEGLTRSASSMAAAGNTLEQTIGLIAAGTSVTQDSKSVAQALKTISMRLRGSKTELEAAGEDTEGMATSVSKLREEMLALSGVDIMVDDSTFKETYDVIDELSYKWQNLTDIQRASITELIAGKRNGNVLNAILSQMSIARETVADANTAAVGSMESQLSVYNESIQASLDKFHVAFEELSYDLINSDTIKGIVDFGTVFLRILDELIEHIGVLGTALTGLGVAKIFTTAVNGAKSVEVASDGVELLSTALEAAQGSGAGLTGVLKGLSGTLGGLGAKAGGAGSALGGLFSSIGGVLTTPAGLGVAAVGAIVGAGVLAYKAYKKQQEELTKQATEATKSWNDSQTKIDEYKQKYIDLNKQLSDSNLSEQQKIGIKQQLLDLQNQITAKYGEQAQGIDLINGGLETQLGILSSISEEEARRNIRDNREAYELAEKEMTRQRTFKVNNGDLDYIDQSGLQEQIVQAFKNSGFEKTTVGFKFTGDATEFESAADKVFEELDKLKDEALLSSDRDIIDGLTKNLGKVYQKNNETLQAYRDNYKAYIQQQLYKDGFGDELSEYAKRVQDYNNALFSGDSEKINEAKTQLDEYKEGTVKEITDAHSEYGDFFDEVANSVDATTEKVYQFKDVLAEGATASSNDLRQYESQIKSSVNNLKGLGLDGVDVQNILLHGGIGFEDLSALAKIYDPNFDFSEDAVRTFADFLAQLDVVASGAGDGLDLAKDSFEGFLKVASASIETVEKANAALVNSFGNKGLSMGIDAETGAITGDVATIIDAYKDLKGYDAKVLFERTADGINVNADALRALQAEQEATVKADFIRRIAEAQKEIGKAGTVEGKKYWEDQLETVRLLSSAYDGATSAYQKWIDAQKMTSPGAKYDAIATNALKQAKEYYDEGLVGNPVFKSIAQLFTNEDLSLASNEEITKAYEDGVDVVKKYFTEGSEGAEAFADKLVELNLAKKEGEEYDFSESGINTTELANELGISVDLVEAAFGKLQEHGWDINFINDDQLTKLGELGEKAESARERLAELADEEGKVGGTDISSVIDIDVSGIDTIDECNEAIEQINEAKANAEVDSEEYQYLDSLLEDITLMRDVLEQETKPTVDDSSLVSADDTYNSLIERIKYLANLNTSVPGVYVDIQNDEQVRELADTLLNMDDEEIKAKLGIEGIDTVDGIIEKLKQEHIDVPVTANTSGMQVQAETSGTINYTTGTVEGVGAQTAVLNYITGTIPPIPTQTALVDYSTNKIEKVPNQDAKINYSNGYIEDVPDQSATIYYTASISGLGALPQDGEHRTIYINTVERYKGTVTKSAFQAMSSAGSVTSGSSHANGTLGKVGLKHDETALINELGSEIVVRPSEDSWMIFNDGKPTFAPLKKGDVKIYCVHVQRCA